MLRGKVNECTKDIGLWSILKKNYGKIKKQVIFFEKWIEINFLKFFFISYENRIKIKMVY